VRDQGFVPQLSVVVEDVRSLWNVGSIFRTADGAAFQHIFLCGITGAPPRREIEKVSLGAEKNISWQYVVNPLTALESLRLGGVQVMGLERTDESITLKEALSSEQVHRPLSLVVGNEVSGLSPQALSLCDLVCHLPMRGMKESLNVAVAYGVAAYMISDHLLPG
jgi:tRNA G18 (ribose-2'-O)-methylase SpoU